MLTFQKLIPPLLLLAGMVVAPMAAATSSTADAGLTAQDQGTSTDELIVTRRIRQGIVADDTLSFNAHNVKIISKGSRVFLKGKVNSLTEKNKVAAIAHRVAGTAQVVDELQIGEQPKQGE